MRQRRGTLTEVVVGDGRQTLTLVFFNQPARAAGEGRRRAVRRHGRLLPGPAAVHPPRLPHPRPATTTRTGPARSSRSTRRARTSPAGSCSARSSCCWTPPELRQPGRGPAARGAPRAPRAAVARRRPARRPPADLDGRRPPGAGAAEVGRGARPAARPGRPPPGRRARARHRPAAARGRPARRLRRRACRSSSPPASGRSARSSPRSWPASTRCTGCCRARSAPARPWWRCGRCCRWSTPAGRRRCSRRPRCSPPSTPRHPRSCSARSAGPASSTAPPSGTRVVLLTGSLPAAARREARCRGADGPGRHRRRHPRAAPGGRRVRRPRAGRGRRAAPLRRRAARRAARQGQPPAARAGDDRDADPAHGRDDRVRRPGGVDAAPSCPAAAAPVATTVVPRPEKPAWLDRAWQRIREEVAAGRQAYVVCPRIGEESGPDDQPEDADGAPDDGRGERRRAPPAAGRARRRSSCCAPGRWPGCGSRCCTAGCRPRTRSARCAPSPPARSTCWWRRRWSRSASTCRTPR